MSQFVAGLHKHLIKMQRFYGSKHYIQNRDSLLMWRVESSALQRKFLKIVSCRLPHVRGPLALFPKVSVSERACGKKKLSDHQLRKASFAPECSSPYYVLITKKYIN